MNVTQEDDGWSLHDALDCCLIAMCTKLSHLHLVVSFQCAPTCLICTAVSLQCALCCLITTYASPSLYNVHLAVSLQFKVAWRTSWQHMATPHSPGALCGPKYVLFHVILGVMSTRQEVEHVGLMYGMLSWDRGWRLSEEQGFFSHALIPWKAETCHGSCQCHGGRQCHGRPPVSWR
eukprot:scaffold230205_cov21-Tisochrysis_lutea.AAC.1